MTDERAALIAEARKLSAELHTTYSNYLYDEHEQDIAISAAEMIDQLLRQLSSSPPAAGWNSVAPSLGSSETDALTQLLKNDRALWRAFEVLLEQPERFDWNTLGALTLPERASAMRAAIKAGIRYLESKARDARHSQVRPIPSCPTGKAKCVTPSSPAIPGYGPA